MSLCESSHTVARSRVGLTFDHRPEPIGTRQPGDYIRRTLGKHDLSTGLSTPV
jgi:hypothetical protein